VDGVELARLAAVDENRARVEERLRARGRERLERSRLGDERAAVQLDDALEVGRLRLRRRGELAHEVVLVADPELRVEAPLEADRRAGLLAHPGAAAERAADVARPDLDEVLVLEQARERAVEPARALLRLDGQVRAGHVADEERVPGQEEPRRVVAAPVLDGEGEVLGPVARRAEGGDARVAELQRRPVGERLVVVLGAGLGAHPQGGAGRGGEAPAAGEVVGVVVRLEDVADPDVVLVRELEVVLDLPLRVDDRRLAAVGDHVRGAAEVLVQDLAEEHLAWGFEVTLGVDAAPRVGAADLLGLLPPVLRPRRLVQALARVERVVGLPLPPPEPLPEPHRLYVPASRRRHSSAAAWPSGVARKCSSGTWRNAARASASGSSPSRSSPRTRIRRPLDDSTRARTSTSVLIGTGWR
jgi:hypothetical protein